MEDSRTDSFVFYRTYYNSIMRLENDSDKVELLRCFCLFALDGEIYEAKKDYINSIFEANKFNIEKSLERRKTNQKNGSKGGAPEGNQNARIQPKTTENNQNQPNNNLNENVNVNADAYVNVDEYSYEKENFYGKVNFDEDDKSNGIVKGRREGRGSATIRSVKNLKSSELDSLFPTEEINLVSQYYTELQTNDFISVTTNGKIKTLEDMKKDFERYKRYLKIE